MSRERVLELLCGVSHTVAGCICAQCGPVARNPGYNRFRRRHGHTQNSKSPDTFRSVRKLTQPPRTDAAAHRVVRSYSLLWLIVIQVTAGTVRHMRRHAPRSCFTLHGRCLGHTVSADHAHHLTCLVVYLCTSYTAVPRIGFAKLESTVKPYFTS